MEECANGDECRNEDLLDALQDDLHQLTVQRNDLLIACKDLVTVFVGSFAETEIAQRIAEGFPAVRNARAAIIAIEGPDDHPERLEREELWV